MCLGTGLWKSNAVSFSLANNVSDRPLHLLLQIDATACVSLSRPSRTRLLVKVGTLGQLKPDGKPFDKLPDEWAQSLIAIRTF